MKFCKECNNILHPQEKAEPNAAGDIDHILIFKCQTCDYFERSDPHNPEENCVYMNDSAITGHKFKVEPEYIYDPTLSRA